MPIRMRPLALVGALALVLLTGAAAPPRYPLEVAIVWHLHQPFFPKRGHSDVYQEPWVRLHAVKDYLEMAQLVARHRVHVTFDFTPSLIWQLEAYDQGATDRALELSSIAAILLSPAQKREIHRTFFTATPAMTAALPRYRELQAKPEEDYTTADWRDLQVLANLVWLSPSARRQPGMAALFKKGRGFTEADKRSVLMVQRALLAKVLPEFARLAKSGQIEIATTPYAHPILPLLVDSDIAEVSQPNSVMPHPAFRRVADARIQIARGVAIYRHWLGWSPAGMWPPEGGVSPAVMPLLRAAKIRWIATDESILARTLGVGLRQGGKLVRPDLLTDFWRAGQGPFVLFRDHGLSDRIGFEYPSWKGPAAARDLVHRLDAIAAAVDRSRPRLLAIVLDGQNPWSAYPDNGEAFLDSLYTRLDHDPELETVTPGEALGLLPETRKRGANVLPLATTVLSRALVQPLPRPIWPGAWVDGTFASWIGQPDKNRAWAALQAARTALEEHERQVPDSPDSARATTLLLKAEGSDWFWWEGSNAPASQASRFDAMFRAYLSAAYRTLGLLPPEYLCRPLGTPPLRARGKISPPLDGAGGNAWQGALTVRPAASDVQAATGVKAIQAGNDGHFLYLAVDFSRRPGPVSFAIGISRRPGGLPRAGVPFPVQYLLDLKPVRPSHLLVFADPPTERPIRTAWGPARVEVAIPWLDLEVHGGEDVTIEPLDLGASPLLSAPLHATVPPLASRAVIRLADHPEGKPPDDALTGFSVENDGPDWAFVFKLEHMARPLAYGAPPPLPILDAYLWTRPASVSAEAVAAPAPLLPGRHARSASPWTAAVVLDAGSAGLFLPNGADIAPARVEIDPIARTVACAVSKRQLPGDPRSWKFLVGSLPPGAHLEISRWPGAHTSQAGPSAFADLLDESLPPATEDDPILPWISPYN